MNDATNGTPRRTRAEWQRLLKAYETSGQPQRAFCKSQGLAYSTFCYWRRRLRGKDAEPATEQPLVELPLWTGEAQESGDFRVELDLGNGMVLRLRS